MRPVCADLLAAEHGSPTSGFDYDDIGWSNELVQHVVEFKTPEPIPALHGWAQRFEAHLSRAQQHLAKLNACILPGAMHPWMDPHRETRLWDHEQTEIYHAFDRIFNCQGHGWSNLQSLHLNLPFSNDDEFGRLHAAIRLLMPIMPALAASSPVMDGQPTGLLDNRLEVYRHNCQRIPSITGRVIPEPVFRMDDYHALLAQVYQDVAPHDPQGVLQDEWVNARGAIARFQRYSIEIRVLDVQECPRADFAVASAILATLKLLAAEQWSDLASQQAWAVDPLANLLERCIRDADAAVIDDPAYLKMFGYTRSSSCSAGELWRHLVQSARQLGQPDVDAYPLQLDALLEHGPLARRLLRALPHTPERTALRGVYSRLARCAAELHVFDV